MTTGGPHFYAEGEPREAYLLEAIPGTDGFWSYQQRRFATVTVPGSHFRLIRYKGRLFYRDHGMISQHFSEIDPKHVVEVTEVRT